MITDIEVNTIATIGKLNRIQVDFPIDLIYYVPFENVTVAVSGSYQLDGKTVKQTKDKRLKYLVDQYEDRMKTEWPEFIVRDETRAATIVSETKRQDDCAGEGWEAYDLMVQWPVKAKVRLLLEVTVNGNPADHTDAIYEGAVQAAEAWVSARPFVEPA